MKPITTAAPTTQAKQPGMTQSAIDYIAIKEKQNLTWASGDYAKVGTTLQIIGESLAEAMDLRPGARVLDVAAGNGNVSLALARRGCQVTSTDYVQSLLQQGAARANAEGMNIEFQIADAEHLPFADASFDAVASTLGVMFAPNQMVAATEMMRVCRSKGLIGLANWTPESFIGQMFKVLGRHLPPPAGLSSPAQWGHHQWINDTFAPHTQSIQIREREFMFRYASAEEFIDVFRTYYGPIHKAFAALQAEQQIDLHKDLVELVMRFNTRSDHMRVPSTYVEILIVND